MLQVAFERGWINPEKFDPRAPRSKQYYTIKDKTDKFGTHDKQSSLCLIIQKMPDFRNEETLLQHHAKNMVVIVIHSPNSHPELAGEGVEYDWAFGKNRYWCHSLVTKRKKESFRDLVKHCI